MTKAYHRVCTDRIGKCFPWKNVSCEKHVSILSLSLNFKKSKLLNLELFPYLSLSLSLSVCLYVCLSVSLSHTINFSISYLYRVLSLHILLSLLFWYSCILSHSLILYHKFKFPLYDTEQSTKLLPYTRWHQAWACPPPSRTRLNCYLIPGDIRLGLADPRAGHDEATVPRPSQNTLLMQR